MFRRKRRSIPAVQIQQALGGTGFQPDGRTWKGHFPLLSWTQLASADPYRQQRMHFFGGRIAARLSELRDDFIAVGDEDPNASLDLPDVGAQIVLEIPDSDPPCCAHASIVGTRSHCVNAGGCRGVGYAAIRPTRFVSSSS